MTTADQDRETAHAQICEGHEPHTAAECPDYGWDEEGMFLKSPALILLAEQASHVETAKVLWQVTL